MVGSIVATAEIPKKDRDDILKQLMDFTQYVYDQQTESLAEESKDSMSSTDEAYGVWKPE